MFDTVSDKMYIFVLISKDTVTSRDYRHKLQTDQGTNEGIKVALPCVWFYRRKLQPDLQIKKMINMVLPCVLIISIQDNQLIDQKRRWMKPYHTNGLSHTLITHIRACNVYVIYNSMCLVIVDLSKSFKKRKVQRTPVQFSSVKSTP